MTLKFQYSHATWPATPIVEVVLATPDEGFATAVVAAVIDTGADASFASINLLESIHAPISEPLKARSLWGEWQEFPTFLVDVRIGGLICPGIEMLGYTGDEIVLGRDILNRLWLGLDGPAQVLEVADTRPRRR